MEKVKKVSSDKLKTSAEINNTNMIRFEKEYMYGFSWPQRSYKCSFCKKEFKSAQALGGHMNVHRRDRARLRESSPSWVDCPNHIPSPNPNPNPNLNFSSSSSSGSTSLPAPAVRFLPYPTNYHFALTTLTLTSPAVTIAHSGCDFVGPQLEDVRKKLSFGSTSTTSVDAGQYYFKDLAQENRVRKNQEVVRLGMEMDPMGLLIDEEGLDLELRLGRSN